MNINRLLKWSGFLSLFLLATFSAAQRSPSNPALLLDVQRDYTSNIRATDRDWFYKDANGDNLPAGGGQYPLIEVPENNTLGIDKTNAVYVRGNNIVVKVKLKTYLNNPNSVVGTLTLDQAKYVSNGTENTITISGPSTVSVPGSGGSQEITLTFSGLPNFVSKGQLKFRYFVTLTQPSGSNPTDYIAWGQTSTAAVWPDTFYITDQTPTGLQTIPWTDLLYYSCTWAHGKVGVTDVSWELTFGTFWNSPIIYSQSNHGYFESIQGDEYRYHRSAALDDFYSLGLAEMDCQDTSGFLHQLEQSQGFSPTIVRIKYSGGRGLSTNYICPIGSDATQLPVYIPYIFGGHQMIILTGAIDPTFAQYRTPAGVDYYNPPHDWAFSFYLQNFPYYYPSPIYGLVFGYVPNSPNYPQPDTELPDATTAFLMEVK